MGDVWEDHFHNHFLLSHFFAILIGPDDELKAPEPVLR